MFCRIVVICMIGLIANSATADLEDLDKPEAQSMLEETQAQSVPIEDMNSVSAPPPEVNSKVGKAAGKDCSHPMGKAVSVRDADTPAVMCRYKEDGLASCQEVCGVLGFKVGECKTTGYRPKHPNSSCVCTNKRNIGVVVNEYEGHPSLHHKKGYYEKFFPMRTSVCNSCACSKGCERAGFSAKESKPIVPFVKGECARGQCICVKAYYAEYEEKLAKRKGEHLNN